VKPGNGFQERFSITNHTTLAKVFGILTEKQMNKKKKKKKQRKRMKKKMKKIMIAMKVLM
jgi:DNA polymerase elongation subunit (family B)